MKKSAQLLRTEESIEIPFQVLTHLAIGNYIVVVACLPQRSLALIHLDGGFERMRKKITTKHIPHMGPPEANKSI